MDEEATQGQGIFYRECTTVKEFMGELHPSNSLWREPGRRWIFRGHANLRWRLVPMAFRKDAWKDFGEFDPTVSEAERSIREMKLLYRFGAEMDRVGLALPEKAYDTLNQLMNWIAEGFGPQWIRDCAPIAALAQHHGLANQAFGFHGTRLRCCVLRCSEAR